MFLKIGRLLLLSPSPSSLSFRNNVPALVCVCAKRKAPLCYGAEKIGLNPRVCLTAIEVKNIEIAMFFVHSQRPKKNCLMTHKHTEKVVSLCSPSTKSLSGTKKNHIVGNLFESLLATLC